MGLHPTPRNCFGFHHWFVPLLLLVNFHKDAFLQTESFEGRFGLLKPTKDSHHISNQLSSMNHLELSVHTGNNRELKIERCLYRSFGCSLEVKPLVFQDLNPMFNQKSKRSSWLSCRWVIFKSSCTVKLLAA